uniref:Uncharacterized protein n=1 Tax=Aureoumbra lagunensis TaxID=44058 RepID=A0A7S3K585_9STRA|mmetsp:Transcript_20796/g.31812  ORF Transcript_20796/g.31812 Transcript_20796/m.31812 type:complete len:418 (-) Transcript_20796:6-1259(-)
MMLGIGEGDDEELLSGILGADLAEEQFMAGLVGEGKKIAPTLSSSNNAEMNPVQKNGKKSEDSLEDLGRLCSKRKELSGVVTRRLKKGAEDARRALAETQGAPELRAALRAVLASISSAVEADNERCNTDVMIDDALQMNEFDLNGNCTQRASIEAACARARAEARAQALGALAQQERLREKCALYKNRISQLETKLSQQQWIDVPLDSPRSNNNKISALEKQLAKANDRLAALVGTQRHARLAALESELEERALIIAALRQALDQMPENNSVLQNENGKTPLNTPPSAPKLRYLPSIDTESVGCNDDFSSIGGDTPITSNGGSISTSATTPITNNTNSLHLPHQMQSSNTTPTVVTAQRSVNQEPNENEQVVVELRQPQTASSSSTITKNHSSYTQQQQRYSEVMEMEPTTGAFVV